MVPTKSTPPPPADPVLEQYRLYEDNGKIYFTRQWSAYRTQRRHFAYILTSRELWRVYARNLKPYKRVPSWHNPESYIRSHRLEPVIPKYLRLDAGL